VYKNGRKMPELAEVALYARDLNRLAKKQRLTNVRFPNQRDWGSVIVPNSVRKQLKGLVGEYLTFGSAGKALHLMSGGEPVVEWRLGMTGQFHATQKSGKWKRHYFLILEFGSQLVYYADPRRFGRIQHPRPATFCLAGYSDRRGLWSKKKTPLPKGYLTRPRISWLLGVGEKTGVGNYMANEALGILRLSPFEPCKSKNEAHRLLSECLKIARRSFRHGGNSFGTGFYRLDGAEGEYARFCKFYGNPGVRRHLFQGRPIFSNFAPKPHI
jgi:formamidopyrimidine-DNA glycosylase